MRTLKPEDAQLGGRAAATPTNSPAQTFLPHISAVTPKFGFPAEGSGKCAGLAVRGQPYLEASSKQLVWVCSCKISAVKPASAIIQNEKTLIVEVAFNWSITSDAPGL